MTFFVILVMEQGSEPIRMDGKIVDPEIVKKGVRNLMQQVAQVEREKDDYKSQISNMNRQLEEIGDIHKKTDSKLNSTIHILRKLQDEKVELESKLGQKQSILLSQVHIYIYLVLQSYTYILCVGRRVVVRARVTMCHKTSARPNRNRNMNNKFRPRPPPPVALPTALFGVAQMDI